jgi:hypothetical protein
MTWKEIYDVSKFLDDATKNNKIKASLTGFSSH